MFAWIWVLATGYINLVYMSYIFIVVLIMGIEVNCTKMFLLTFTVWDFFESSGVIFFVSFNIKLLEAYKVLD